MTPRPAPRKHFGTDADLIDSLLEIDGRPYGAYSAALGEWDYGRFTIAIDKIQADPYAPPSAVRVISTPEDFGIPADALVTSDARLATADFLLRSFERTIRSNRDLHAARPGQEILQRSACSVFPDRLELRLQVSMPARGRTIMGRQAAQIFDVDLPNAVFDAIDLSWDEVEVSAGPSDEVSTAVSESVDEAPTTGPTLHNESAHEAPLTETPAAVSVGEQEKAENSRIQALREHIRTYEDHRALQTALAENDWLAFVADGSALARRSGISDTPLPSCVAFESPESLRVSVTLPHAGEVTGMAIRPGVTVIAGGGYHGKSTLLSAIERGVYAHIPGDGRELVATTRDAMKIRAADGRSVTSVDISGFISDLPTGADTRSFSTENASGSTSQAASIVEAIELGSPLLLIDEDTSATNLLIRDSLMRELVRHEPITPLVDRVRDLAEAGFSTILVMGGSSAYLRHADCVILLDSYRCVDASERARELAGTSVEQSGQVDVDLGARRPQRIRKPERSKTKAIGLSTIVLDKQEIDVADVAGIVDPGQTEAIAWLVRGILEQLASGDVPLPKLLARAERRMNSEGLDACVKFGARPNPGYLARPRMIDVGAALNRYRALKVVSD